RSDVILTYLSEKTKLIYTCVNYTQDGDTVKILEYYYGTPTGSSSSDDDDDGRSAEEERNLEYAKTHPGGAHTYIQQVVSDPTGEKDGVMINVCRHCGFVEKGSEQVISAYGNFNAIVLASVKNAQAGGTAEMETARWISVHRRVLEALAGNPGVTLKIHFIYEGTKHVLTIPGNDSRLATLLEREDEYFGFMFLGTMFPMATEE
ncbi:MAG: hypothetical protein IJ600_10025, partial [Lachnospiraceae bacterium]|nr:hypothetical protein [Lachnospiraceae bacterium]